MRLAFLALLAVAATLPAQPVRISGRIVEEGTTTPVSGAVVRVTGSDSTMTTGASGTFSFSSLIPGRLVLTVSAPFYEFLSLPLELYRDTILTLSVRRRITTLDPMVVRPRQIRVRGTVLDSATGEALLFAQVSLYPEGRFAEASNIGRFSFDKVPAGQVTVLVEALEHLPTIVTLNTSRDTNLTIRVPVDSVAVRIMAAQAIRLAERSQANPYTVRSWDRDLIARERRSSVGELVDRIMLVPNDPRRRAGQSADDACVFYDDKKIAPGMLDGLYPELVERVEVYHNGAMIRVYSKQYVMSLAGQANLRRVTYIPVGMRTVCE